VERLRQEVQHVFGSENLEIVIGLVFVYVLLSLVCTALNEGIAKALKLRAKTLEQGMKAILDDPSGSHLALKIFQHPLVKGLGRSGWNPEEALRKKGLKKLLSWNVGPSYIPARTFALAIFDINIKDTNADAQVAEQVQSVVQPFLTATKQNLDQARQQLEDWFDDAMDRGSPPSASCRRARG